MKLLEELELYTPFNEFERAMCERLKTFLRSLADEDEAKSRELAGTTPEWGHLTASSWIINNDATRVVLLHHRKLGKWLQPGGHLDGDADLRVAAMREAQEETGLDLSWAKSEIFDLDVHEIPQYWNTPAHLHFDVRFLLCADSSQAPVLSNESHGMKWCDLDEAAALSKGEESVARMIEKTKLL